MSLSLSAFVGLAAERVVGHILVFFFVREPGRGIILVKGLGIPFVCGHRKSPFMEEWVERPKTAFTALGVAPQKSVLPSTITGAGWTLAVSNSRALPSRLDLFQDRV